MSLLAELKRRKVVRVAVVYGATAPAAQGDEGVTPALLGKRTLAVAGLLVVLGIGLSAGWLLKPRAPGPVEPAAVVEPGPSTVPGGTDEERQPEAMPAAERESIAVLPFVLVVILPARQHLGPAFAGI